MKNCEEKLYNDIQVFQNCITKLYINSHCIEEFPKTLIHLTIIHDNYPKKLVLPKHLETFRFKGLNYKYQIIFPISMKCVELYVQNVNCEIRLPENLNRFIFVSHIYQFMIHFPESLKILFLEFKRYYHQLLFPNHLKYLFLTIRNELYNLIIPEMNYNHQLNFPNSIILLNLILDNYNYILKLPSNLKYCSFKSMARYKETLEIPNSVKILYLDNFYGQVSFYLKNFYKNTFPSIIPFIDLIL